MGSINEKNRVRKSRDTAPLNVESCPLNFLFKGRLDDVKEADDSNKNPVNTHV